MYDLWEVVNTQPGLFSVPLYMYGVPDIIVQAVDGLVLQHLNTIADIVTELDGVTICK